MLKKETKEKLKKQGRIYPKQMSSILKELDDILPYDKDTYRSDLEFIYCQVYDLDSPKKCKCGNRCTFYNFKEGYTETCGDRKNCEYAKHALVEAMRKTCIKKYGAVSPMHIPEFKEKLKETNLKKYGNTTYLQTTDGKEKTKQTLLKKYGVDSALKSKEIKDKIAKTNIEKYGVANPFAADIIKEKIVKTNIEKYGVANINTLESIKSKIRKTNTERYGVACYTQTEEYKDKARKTNIEKYGVDNIFKSKHFQEAVKQNKLSKSYKKLVIEAKHHNLIPLFTEQEYIGSGNRSSYKWQCTKCNKIFSAHYYIGCHNAFPACPKCGIYVSSGQLELFNFIKTNLDDTVDIVIGNKIIIAPLELDIYIPELKLAFEFNGSYWHNARRLGKNYHLNKTKLCEEKGIKLIHIWEHDWINPIKQVCIKQRLLNLFRKSDVLYARKCKLNTLTNLEANTFLDSYHLQGSINSKVNLGLYYNNELVSVMTFGKPRFNKNYEWELLRYCSKGRVIGGASKLLKHFEREYKPTSLISYADRCWSISGDTLYSQLGFNLVSASSPNYIWNKSKIVYTRYQTQKHKLKDLLGSNFDPNKSETDNMLDNGFLKLYDCGNLVFVKEYEYAK